MAGRSGLNRLGWGWADLYRWGFSLPSWGFLFLHKTFLAASQPSKIMQFVENTILDWLISKACGCSELYFYWKRTPTSKNRNRHSFEVSLLRHQSPTNHSLTSIPHRFLEGTELDDRLLHSHLYLSIFLHQTTHLPTTFQIPQRHQSQFEAPTLQLQTSKARRKHASLRPPPTKIRALPTRKTLHPRP